MGLFGFVLVVLYYRTMSDTYLTFLAGGHGQP